MRSAVTEYCAIIGVDPMLVQGAGGNVSWKEEDTLWVKASGTWLADARKKEIFVPVALSHLRGAMDGGDFHVTPRTLFGSDLRPSIETMLHALMPQQVVVHVHAIEILAHLVKQDFRATIASKIKNGVRWITTGYHKPGAELAHAVKSALTTYPSAQVVFLQNHGVVIAGEDIADADRILRKLIKLLTCRVRDGAQPVTEIADMELLLRYGYKPVPIGEVHRLATDLTSFQRLSKYWALYPDHVVFLGDKPNVFEDVEAFCQFYQLSGQTPELIFIKGAGVFEHKPLSPTKYAYLQCYSDVMRRQSEDAKLVTLRNSDINDLLSWDAEKFRQAMPTITAT